MRNRFTLADDLLSAFGLLTRLPLPPANRHRPGAAWAWPLVGLVVGAAMAGLGWAGMAVGLPAGLVALILLATGASMTGALHEDGLADCADGFFGGWTRERRLEIMKDSHIGSYGTLALILATLARVAALMPLLQAGGWGAMIVAAVLSRAPMAVIMTALPPAREVGLSHSVGRPPMASALAAVGLALMLAIWLAPPIWLGMAIAAALAAFAVALLARAKIGGQTGDVLGASQQLAEIAALAAASPLFP